MNWKAKFRIVFSVIIVLLLCAALVMWLDARRATAVSESAEINATSYTVGIDHSGLITQQLVEAGDQVTKGQTLFHVRSTSLLELINDLELTEAELLYPLNAEDEILVQATRPGIVSEVEYSQGSFVPANSVLATIINQDKLEVVATYQLARRDFTKLSLQTHLEVRLPEGNWTEGQVRNIEVVEQEERMVKVELTANIEGSGEGGFRSTSGVPVETRIELQETTLYERTKSWISSAIDRVRGE